MTPRVLVAADFVETGGMDMANFALAKHLASRDHEVHLVAHRVAPELRDEPNVTVHLVRKPLDSYLLGEPFLDVAGRQLARTLERRGGRAVVNGGNCRWGDVNWVHYVHAAFARQPAPSASWARRVKESWAASQFVRNERQALRRARVVIANSERTRRDVVEFAGVPAERVHTVYLGIDPERFRPPSRDARNQSRQSLGWTGDRLKMAFVGSLGDRRKGFDTLFAAWDALSHGADWDVDLVVVGTGAELADWKALANQKGLQSNIEFLGFRTDVPRILAGCDALVAPSRYESFGLGVQEALCCGLPALVSRSAGVAERYPAELDSLLIDDPDDTARLADQLRVWRRNIQPIAEAVARMSEQLRAHTWEAMSGEIAAIIDRTS